ncbi:MAG: hypothetical protein PVF50_12370 [Gammaproteobacteria bacterium]|jgi:hypothetical protein
MLPAGHVGAQRSAFGPPEDPQWTLPRLPWGDPDLQGVWRYEATIPLERPPEFADRPRLSDAEIAAIEREEAELAERRLAGLDGEAVGRASLEDSPIRGNEYNAAWQDHGRPRQVYAQTSLIVDPPNGRLPYTDDARAAAARATARYGVGPYESYLDPDTGERCLTDGVTALMWQGPNGGHNRIVQSPGFVTILHEEYRDRRIIPLDGGDHHGIPQWLGEPIGRFEGDTLVVETENFLDRTNYEWASLWMRASAQLKLVERFRRVGANLMEYTITVEDPQTFTQPWTARIPIARLEEGTQIYEYACHEGNYAMPNLLRGNRVTAGGE